jgi:hypothetical protein
MTESKSIDLLKDAPDYSKSTKEFTTWAYSSTYDGWWQTLDENKKFIRLENSETTPVPYTKWRKRRSLIRNTSIRQRR